MADWLDHNPPAIGLDPAPLYPDPPLAGRESLFMVWSAPQEWSDPDPADLWVEQEAELACHVPSCGVWYTDTGICTENCLVPECGAEAWFPGAPDNLRTWIPCQLPKGHAGEHTSTSGCAGGRVSWTDQWDDERGDHRYEHPDAFPHYNRSNDA
jgi:hypothetical protein